MAAPFRASAQLFLVEELSTEHGHQQDLDIQQNAPVLDVKVELNIRGCSSVIYLISLQPRGVGLIG